MALVSLAVVGRDNEPLYLRDFVTNHPADAAVDLRDDATDTERQQQQNDDDAFGFFNSEGRGANDSCSLRHQFIIHAALDRFEEMTGSSSGGRWRTPGAVGNNAMWVGLLCPIEEVRVYGYLTNTGIKFLVLVEDEDDGQDSNQTSARDKDLKAFMVLLHDLFVEYTLNPFSKLRGKISSNRFDVGVQKYVQALNAKQSSKT
mmetsp:Transcript_10964/g.23722  ORF Transcript_10964/g.23722 Transcript_10964/m.23722 type:complete len:202 (-) Transcript_10964:193-798(-)